MGDPSVVLPVRAGASGILKHLMWFAGSAVSNCGANLEFPPILESRNAQKTTLCGGERPEMGVGTTCPGVERLASSGEALLNPAAMCRLSPWFGHGERLNPHGCVLVGCGSCTFVLEGKKQAGRNCSASKQQCCEIAAWVAPAATQDPETTRGVGTRGAAEDIAYSTGGVTWEASKTKAIAAGCSVGGPEYRLEVLLQQPWPLRADGRVFGARMQGTGRRSTGRRCNVWNASKVCRCKKHVL